MDISKLRERAQNRVPRTIDRPSTENGPSNVSEYFGELTFDFSKEKSIPDSLKKELSELRTSGNKISVDQAKQVARAVQDWALSLGCTHFCHWFQPLTGATAEKHDAFLSFKGNSPIEQFDVKQLLQGEPDASSFPSGGARTTFEARGYTSWDISSPFFIVEGLNGSTLCIPTAFVSYHGDALDIKTPLLRSVNALDAEATKFLNLVGKTDVNHVFTTCGPEQEYFLVDKAFYYSRTDLVMTGRTLFGLSTAKNQQLDDHYFGSIPQRVKNFMDEFNYELHRLGIPAKTQHNEVAPGQFELAPIFEDANVAADHNQLLMSTLERIAERHDFKALLHEKPFPGINGSGKHLNWSIATDTGENLLEPTETPEKNNLFLAICSIVIEAVNRHGDALRMSIASHGNDHRLGANEAPPSIISVFLGDTLNTILTAVMNGQKLTSESGLEIDGGARQLAMLSKDNTDRNRTSPFAFTGNKFEFRAVGSTQAIGYPLTILNTAVSKAFKDTNAFVADLVKQGKNSDEILLEVCKKWMKNSHQVIFNGDNYSSDWVEEAKKRGLPNLKTSAEALGVLRDEKAISFLTEMGVLSTEEIKMRHNAFIEKYITCREIEFESLKQMVFQYVIPATTSYKYQLTEIIAKAKDAGVDCFVEKEMSKKLSLLSESLYTSIGELSTTIETMSEDPIARAKVISGDLLPLSEKIAELCNQLEEIVPRKDWELPTYLDMLFIR